MNSKLALCQLIECALKDGIINSNDLKEIAEGRGPLASGVTITGSQEQGPPPTAPPGVYRGNFKSFNPKQGYGFIACQELSDQYNADVFVHKNVYQRVYPPLNPNEAVEFQIHVNKEGKPQASNIRRTAMLY